MPCDLSNLQPRDKECLRFVGGLKAIYVKAFNLQNTEVLDDYVKFELHRNAGSMEETIGGEYNGAVSYTQTIIGNFRGIKQRDIDNLIALGRSSALHVVVEDNNGLQRLCGHKLGCQLTDGGTMTGLAMPDRNGVSFTFTGIEKEPASIVTLAPAP